MVNKYVWDLYLKSGGDQIVNLFRDTLHNSFSPDYASGIRKMQELFVSRKRLLLTPNGSYRQCVQQLTKWNSLNGNQREKKSLMKKQ